MPIASPPPSLDVSLLLTIVGLMATLVGTMKGTTRVWKWACGVGAWFCALGVAFQIQPLTPLHLTVREQITFGILSTGIAAAIAISEARRVVVRSDPETLERVAADARELAAKIRAFVNARWLSHPSDRLSRLYDESKRPGMFSGDDNLLGQVDAARESSPAHEQQTLSLYYDRFTKPVQRMRDRLAAHGITDADFDKLLAGLPENLTYIVDVAHYLTALGQAPK